MKNPWYKHYPGDYGRDTAHLSLVQHGAYRLLLDHYYSTSAPLPNDLVALYRICRAFDEAERKAVDLVVSQFFELRIDGYHNARADKELAERAANHERQSLGGRKTAKKRWGSHSLATSSADSSAVGNPDTRYQTPEPEKGKVKTFPPAKAAGDDGFDVFWEAYPKKLGKKDARRAWIKAQGRDHLGEILAAITNWSSTPDWRKDDGQFIPYPATWLNREFWKENPNTAVAIMRGELDRTSRANTRASERSGRTAQALNRVFPGLETELSSPVRGVPAGSDRALDLVLAKYPGKGQSV